MAPAGRRRRRPNPEETESEDEVEQKTSPITKDFKRVNLSQRDSTQNNASSTLSSDDGDTAVSSVDITTYQPGSIVRITLTNFVTYTSVEFNLGPSLNMVIGPNGTGKSTLVCAICLGLGWGPKNLGRAKELGEFVKHGAQQATIEIELQGGPDQNGRNILVRRIIKKDGNKSVWFLDNEPSTNAKVLQLARSFSIQIDNLCQFLPQDRVVEFAQMHPVEMLASTQQAAASVDMIEMHEELKTLKAEEIQEQVHFKTNKEQLNVLQTRQNQQRADVERMEERTNLKNKMELYDKFRPLIKYKEIRIKDRDAKEKLKSCQEELQELEAQVEPSLRSLRNWQSHSNNLNQLKETRRQHFNQSERMLAPFTNKILKIENQMEDNESKRKVEVTADKQRKQDMGRLQEKLQRLEKELEDTRVEYDADSFQSRLQEVRDKKRRSENDLREIDNALKDLEEQVRPLQSKINSLKHEINSLQSHAGRRLQKLKMLSRDTARAYEWLQANEDKFEGKIHGPPLISCSVKDPRYADIVESTLTKSDFLMFTCTSNRDLKLFQSIIFGRELGLADVTVRSITKPLQSFRSPISTEDLNYTYGLEGWMIDLLDGPEAVLAALCDSSRMHRTGYSLRDVTNDQFQKLRDSEDVPSWATSQTVNSVTRRKEYGPKAVSIQTKQVRKAAIWTDSVDTNAEDSLTRQLTEANQKLDEVSSVYQAKRSDKSEPEHALRESQNEINKIMAEKDKAQRAYGIWRAIPDKIKAFKEKKHNLDEGSHNTPQVLAELVVQKDDLFVRKATITIEYAHAVKSLERFYFELVEAELWAVEAKSQEDVLKLLNSEVALMLRNKKSEVQELEIYHREIRTEGKRLASEATAISTSLTTEERAVHRELNDQDISLDQLEAEILSMTTRLGLLHEGNPGALAQYEKRKIEIEKLVHLVESSTSKLSRLNAQMEEIRERWEPQLDELVSRISDAFSHNFAQIGCAGQVSVHKDDDFAKWEIRIFVKFRENEQLSILNNHRQSGGERSVSTIFYLMALQSLARSPFRVVDEINQGMDPRNERTVHERMVDIACGENKNQYFLITPKLLTGLKYHPRMKLHVINSGESVPDDLHELNLTKIVNQYAHSRGIAVV